MQTVDEKPETIHVYVVRDEVPKPSLFPIFLSTLALSLLVNLCVFSSYQQPDIRLTIRVPAVLLPIKTFTTTAAIIPTGIKMYPAITAHGILTITNGSVIASELPSGLIFTSRNGTEIQTVARVFVPAGNAAGFGYATVPAHALQSGKYGNFTAYAINQVEGTSIYIRNLKPFTGGKDAYSLKVLTSQDRQSALLKARSKLDSLMFGFGYVRVHPCTEVLNAQKSSLKLVWTCQFATFSLPAYMKVTRVAVEGKNLLLDVVYRPRYMQVGQK